MKSVMVFFTVLLFFCAANAFKLQSQRDLGSGEAKNQNVVVKCTTADGKVSNQTCSFRRLAKCVGGKCVGWQKWSELRSPGKSFDEWRDAAVDCCAAKGLR
ncbi:MAG: hypothetical protein LBB08_01845 [Rickettsiales bacterium]|nr:hypothetical protein [Rickettsiales bacterium]